MLQMEGIAIRCAVVCFECVGVSDWYEAVAEDDWRSYGIAKLSAHEEHVRHSEQPTVRRC